MPRLRTVRLFALSGPRAQSAGDWSDPVSREVAGRKYPPDGRRGAGPGPAALRRPDISGMFAGRNHHSCFSGAGGRLDASVSPDAGARMLAAARKHGLPRAAARHCLANLNKEDVERKGPLPLY